jgi:hypothetical protein
MSLPESRMYIKYVSESICITLTMYNKGKAVPLQAWTGPDGSRRSRLPDF